MKNQAIFSYHRLTDSVTLLLINFSEIINLGLFFVSLYILPMYSPITPKHNNWIPPSIHIDADNDDTVNNTSGGAKGSSVYTP